MSLTQGTAELAAASLRKVFIKGPDTREEADGSPPFTPNLKLFNSSPTRNQEYLKK